MKGHFLQRQQDWVLVLIFWGLSLEVGIMLPQVGWVTGLIITVLLLLQSAHNFWVEWGVSLDQHASWRGWTHLILTGLVFIWLVPGLTVGTWLPWLGNLLRPLAC